MFFFSLILSCFYVRNHFGMNLKPQSNLLTSPFNCPHYKMQKKLFEQIYFLITGEY